MSGKKIIAGLKEAVQVAPYLREIQDQAKRIAQLEEALRPFAEYARRPHTMDGAFEGETGEYYADGLRCSISYAALRNAALILGPAD